MYRETCQEREVQDASSNLLSILQHTIEVVAGEAISQHGIDNITGNEDTVHLCSSETALFNTRAVPRNFLTRCRLITRSMLDRAALSVQRQVPTPDAAIEIERTQEGRRGPRHLVKDVTAN